MELTLSADEAKTLRQLLEDYLPELKFEVARADPGDLRHALVMRQNLCEELLVRLARTASEPS